MLTLRGIKIEVTKKSWEELINQISKKIKLEKFEIKNLIIEKESLDARNKNEIFYVYECSFDVDNEEGVLKRNKNNKNVFRRDDKNYYFNKCGSLVLHNKIVIVGSGPAGLFCAYILAENGYKPLIIERGEKVEERIKTVNNFWNTGILNKDSNVQFGEGGAGTFSDGKLNTLVKDEFNRGRKVLQTFVECGAPKEILYHYKPHIGTNILVDVVKNIREKIISMGGEFRYSTKLTNIIIENNKLTKIEVNNSTLIPCDVLVLAIGHSARDTFEMLYSNNLEMNNKPFAVGIRVQHNQDMINASQYGQKYKDILPPATYKLTYQSSNNRGVYSFCMCPGGYVVNASSEENKLVVNGMSNYERETKSANSAIVVTVNSEDYGPNPLDGLEFQRNLEEVSYKLGNGKIPIQTLESYYSNKIDTSKIIRPITKGSFTFSNLNNLFSPAINESLKEAFPYFGKKIKGFDNPNTILLGVESRTSSPIKIKRDENFEASIKGIYPCGEGCGYAGGITSASIDGIKVAEKIGQKYID